MTAALIRSGRIVVRPAPPREPPFDDEVPDEHPRYNTWDQQLPFAVVARRPAWAVRAAGTALASGLPDPSAWSRRLLIGMTETAAGRRPLHQLAAMLSPAVARGLAAEFERSAQRGRPHWLQRATVHTVRACRPAAGVAEIAATVDIGQRVRAVALRLENQHDRWRCVRIQLG